MDGALDGIRILDLSWGIAGPLGVLLLAEHGADVIKVEPPGGDPFRAYGGARCWNRSRRSFIVDLSGDAGRRDFLRLAATADAVVETFRPGVMERLGIGFDALAAVNPRLVLLSCPGYPDGHRLAQHPGYDALVQASSGQMYEQPGWRNGPVFLHMPMPSMGAFYLVASGLLAALSARERTNRGQHVCTSLFQGVLLYTTQIWQEAEHADAAYHEMMGKSYPPGIHQRMIFECAGREWLHLSAMSGLPPLAGMDEVLGLEGAPDPLTALGLRPDEQRALAERRKEKFKTWNRDELVEAFRRQNHAAEAIVPADAILRHPQTVANGTVTRVNDPDIGPTMQMGVPIHLLGTPGRVQGPQPVAGADTAEILASLPELGTPVAPVAPVAASSRSAPALSGVRILDFGQYLAGPFGPMLLGDLGADVVKIEPVSGDGMRMASKPFIGCQRGKRSLALDLKHADGLDVARRLISGADVVHHNMTRGVATRLGIDYAACRQLRPDIIYCNTYAYGLADPLGRFGGLDPLYQASAGLEYEAAAVHEGNEPLYLRFGMCDASNALLSVVGVLMALLHRQRTGEGQELWTSLHDGGLIFSSDVWLGPDGDPWDRPHLDKDLRGLSPRYRIYRTQDDSWICVAAVDDTSWAALQRVIGVAADGDLEAALMTRTGRTWTRLLDEAGVPNELAVDTVDGRTVLHDDDNVRLGLVAEYDHPVLGRLRQFGHLINFSETPGPIPSPPPLVGQHSRDILRAAGFADGDIDDLVGKGVVYEPNEHYAERFRN